MNHFYLLIICFFFNAISYAQIIGEIELKNANHLNQKFVLNLIQTKIGSTIDSTKINEDILVLGRLNAVSKVDFEISKTTNDDCKLTFLFAEKSTIIPLVNFQKVDNLLAYTIGGYDFNFLKKNNIIGGFYRNNGFNSFSLRAAFPQLLSNKMGLETIVQKLVSKEPIYFSNQTANYKYVNTSFELSLNYQIDYSKYIKIGGNLFNEKYDYIDGATAAGIPISYQLNKKLLKFEFGIEHIKYDYYKLDGFKNNVNFQSIIPNKTNQVDGFNVVFNDFNFYKNFGYTNCASRIRLGISTNINSPFAPFTVDNNVNIRGVGFLVDRGTAMIVLNNEIRQTLFEKKWFVLQGNAFVDAGTWRNRGGTFDDLLTQKNIRVYSGLGLRFIHKTIYDAVFRIDYGFGLTQNKSSGIVFGIGQFF